MEASAFEWQSKDCKNLNLLPFGLDDVMLPGETKQVHLFEARFLELFTQAEASDHGCVGQLLILGDGGVVAYTSLLEIEESRKQDIGVWAKLRCVGRVKIADLEPTDFGYYRATVDLVSDQPSEQVGEEALEECLAAHADCHELESKLVAARGEGGSRAEEEEEDDDDDDEDNIMKTPRPGERVEWGHEVNTQDTFAKPLPELRDSRREVLCARGLDAPPTSGLDADLQRLWGASSEAEAEAMLLSFSAGAYLSPQQRAKALGEKDTIERVQSATSTFREVSRRLAAELALTKLSS